ncbi:MAG: hypothetical protein WKF58_09510 [Ilumatobacteraceae bacterium]
MTATRSSSRRPPTPDADDAGADAFHRSGHRPAEHGPPSTDVPPTTRPEDWVPTQPPRRSRPQVGGCRT